MKVYHGNIITVDSKNSIYKFLVEDAGKIVYVGDELPNAYANAEKVELGEKALLPSFVDTPDIDFLRHRNGRVDNNNFR